MTPPHDAPDSASTRRFSDRADDYRRYRPGYPAGLIDWLRVEHGLKPGWLTADIGAGTGISSKLLLDAGLQVMAVEPNLAMRAAADDWLGDHPDFRSVDGTAEATTLPDRSVEMVTCAQAFHWFDHVAIRREWSRILRPGGLVVEFANCRRLTGSAFLEGYERLLREFGTDYVSVAERYPDDDYLRNWFGAGWRGSIRLPNPQQIDFNSLRGRLLSSSYAPRPEHPDHEAMMQALHELFRTTSSNGLVGFDYDTIAHVGTLTADNA